MKYYYYYLLLLVVPFMSCDRESSIGSLLLGEDNIEISFTDTIDLNFTNQYADSLRTFGTNGVSISSPSNHRLGILDDPIFGTTEQRLVVCPNILNVPNFDQAVLDSMILILPLDSLSAYGELNARHHVKVYQLEDHLHEIDLSTRMDTFYTNDEIPLNTSMLVGELDQVIDYEDSVFVYNPTLDSTFIDIPQIRIRLDDTFAETFLDSNNVSSDSLFQSVIKGLVLTSEPDASSLLGISINSLSSATTDATLRVYYKQDGNSLFYDYYLAAFKHSHITHDFAGTIVEDAIENNTDDHLFLQPMAGTFVSLDLAGVKAFEGQGINYAELELFVNQDLGDDLSVFPPSFSVLSIYENEDGNKVVVSDLTSLGAQGYGGNLSLELDEFGNTIRKYRLKITDHVVRIKNGQLDNTVIELVTEEPLEIPRRTVLHGNDGSEYSAKLKLVVSEP